MASIVHIFYNLHFYSFDHRTFEHLTFSVDRPFDGQ